MLEEIMVSVLAAAIQILKDNLAMSTLTIIVSNEAGEDALWPRLMYLSKKYNKSDSVTNLDQA